MRRGALLLGRAKRIVHADVEVPLMSEIVTVYWRPMCGYCTVLKRELDALGIPFDEVDIWEQRDQAEVVRAATGGDEIVPTVRVGERFLVNPAAEDVLHELGLDN
jgi:mycoredoxin